MNIAKWLAFLKVPAVYRAQMIRETLKVRLVYFSKYTYVRTCNVYGFIIVPSGPIDKSRKIRPGPMDNAIYRSIQVYEVKVVTINLHCNRSNGPSTEDFFLRDDALELFSTNDLDSLEINMISNGSQR